MSSDQQDLISRRDALVVIGVGGVASFLLGACSSSTSTTTPVAGGRFVEPETLTSADGTLEVTLRAEAGLVEDGSGSRYGYSYNGQSPGPTLRVRPGDRLLVTVENELDEPTNLHTHGLHVSPDGDSDNIFISIQPGQEHRFVYDIPPGHRSGLFWYHPHVHGTVARQVAAGLVGAIVVEDDLDAIDELAAATERLMILTDPPNGATDTALQADPMEQMVGREGPVVLVNGVSQPVVDVVTGGLEQWRVLNASPTRFFLLTVDGHRLHMIGSDGGRLGEVREVDQLLISPGERAEVLLTPTTPGRFAVRAVPYDRGSAGMGMMGRNAGSKDDLVLATMNCSGGEASAARLPSGLADPVAFVLPEPTVRRTLTLGMNMGGGMMRGESMMSFTIDGREFDPARVDISSELGEVEEWTVRNDTSMDHPFHLHTWPFQVVDDISTPGWKDTVNIPANGQVRLRIPFGDYSGTTVYHCHILDHEDLGMMGVIDVAST